MADHLGLEHFAYAGISLGGAVGAHLAVHHPERITALALLCSSARFGTPEAWHERADLVRGSGTEPLARTAPSRWFTPAFARSPAADELVADQRAADPAAYAACCDALAAFDLRAELPRITAPTLVVAGREDTATPPSTPTRSPTASWEQDWWRSLAPPTSPRSNGPSPCSPRCETTSRQRAPATTLPATPRGC
jgi:3-oxoadipate enol-lactonase/4-carboxymuconolactone decarboxylase